MKKCITMFLVFMFFGSLVIAADYTANVSLNWPGTDSLGNTEPSLPVTIKVYDAVSGAVKSQANVNGPVNAFAMPSFIVPVPDNGSTTLSVYATATDSVGNVSPNSETATVVIKGSDTLLPCTPTISITITK